MAKIAINYNRGELTRVHDGQDSYYLFKIELEKNERLIFGEAVISEDLPPRWIKVNQNSIDKGKIKELLYAGSAMYKTGHRIEIKDICWNNNSSFAIAIYHYDDNGRNKMIEVVLDKNRLESIPEFCVNAHQNPCN